jgi:Flp pilus assembly secretin CpaC
MAYAALLLALGGCSWRNIPLAKSTTGRNPTIAEVPSEKETVRGEDDPPVVTLELGSALHEHRLTASDDLPGNIIVPTTNLNAVPITAALQAVLAGTDVSISWDTGTLGDRLVTVVNLSGPLPKVVEKICAAAKVFCSYRNGSMELQDKDTFIVSMPPISKSVSAASSGGLSSSSGGGGGGGSSSVSSSGTNTMVETISQLVGGKVQLDEAGGNVLYTADVDSENRVSRYLEQLRNGRPLVVMQLYIWEVTLNKENAAGINWSHFQIPNFGPPWAKLTNLVGASDFTTPTGANGSVSLGAITTGKLNTNTLLAFLSTQGLVQTVSNPQMTFVSGSSAQLKVGGQQTYISQVGQLVGTTNTSGTTNPNTNGIGTNTVSTSTINTGLTVNVAGAYENGIVFANLALDLTNVTGLNPTTTNGVTIDLPTTTDENFSTALRVRPGDNLVLAGLVTSSDSMNHQGIPIGANLSLGTYGDTTLQNHELVIVVKPSVILFSDKMAVAEGKKKEEKPLPEQAVLIDKDGYKPVAIPPAPPAWPLDRQPGGPIPLAPADNGAVVDQRLMQRGFSHAFDELLQPVAKDASADGEAQP